jgi:hypothetical protein
MWGPRPSVDGWYWCEVRPGVVEVVRLVVFRDSHCIEFMATDETQEEVPGRWWSEPLVKPEIK